jgi:hypothetical protein
MLTIDELLHFVEDQTAYDYRDLSIEAYEGTRLRGRHGAFSECFYRGLDGDTMGDEALSRHTWANDGYRLGCFVRAAFLMSGASIEQISQENRKRLGDAVFAMWSNLTRQVITSLTR